jgi:hypothetical protein
VKDLCFALHDPIYGHDILIAIGNISDARIIRAFKRAGYTLDADMIKTLKMDDNAQGRTVIDLDTGARVIRLRDLNPYNPKHVAVLSHEATHAAIQLFERLRQPVGNETDEPFAYYVQFIVRSVLEHVIWRKKGK